MSPMVSNSKNKKYQIDINNNDFIKNKNKLIQLREYVEKNFDYVGKDFCKQVREIYYNKKSKKPIYGKATYKEKEELSKEGIDLFSIPWVNKDN